MTEQKKRGGARKGAGRKKQAIPAALDGRSNAARNCAGRVLDQAKSEKLWLAMIELECRRLGIDPKTGVLLDPLERITAKQKAGEAVTDGDYRGNFSIIPLTNLLRYLEDRHYGRPVDTVNHIHDKPIDINMNVNLGERMKAGMARFEALSHGSKRSG
jgi:hypothetical protein